MNFGKKLCLARIKGDLEKGEGRKTEGKKGKWEKRRNKAYYLQVQILYGECDHYIRQICTNKIFKKELSRIKSVNNAS